MNGSYSPSNNNTSQHEKVGYGFGVSIVVLVLIIFIAIASYICNRMYMPQDPSFHPHHLPRTNSNPSSNQHDPIDIESSIPGNRETGSSKAEIHKDKGDTTRSRCSICLADYKETDLLMALPDCHHLFHAKCVEPWLRLNPTCPICRSSPVPVPFSTPRAEVIPFAARGDHSHR